MIKDSLHSWIVLPTAARSGTFSPWPPFLQVSNRHRISPYKINWHIRWSLWIIRTKKPSSQTLKEILINLSGKKNRAGRFEEQSPCAAKLACLRAMNSQFFLHRLSLEQHEIAINYIITLWSRIKYILPCPPTKLIKITLSLSLILKRLTGLFLADIDRNNSRHQPRK